MKRKAFLVLGGISSLLLGCGGSGLSDADGTLGEFNTVIFSSTGVDVEPGIVPLLNTEVRQISQFQGLKACVGDDDGDGVDEPTDGNGRCDPHEVNCRTCADVPVGTPCDGGDFRSVCCAEVDKCFGQPTEFTITFNFKSEPLFDASGSSLPRPTSPVLIKEYSATFSYSPGCPSGLPPSDSKTLSVVVPAPPRGGESSAQVSITYNTQPWLVAEGVSNVCTTTTLINFRLPPDFTSYVCNVNAVFNFTVMEQYTGKKKTITVPVNIQITPGTGECIP